MKKFWNASRDIEIDRSRYEETSKQLLNNNLVGLTSGYEDFPAQHVAPFKMYYSMITESFTKKSEPIKVLEIGAGNGQHTQPILSLKTEVTVLDISESSVDIVLKRYGDKITGVVANIESMELKSL